MAVSDPAAGQKAGKPVDAAAASRRGAAAPCGADAIQDENPVSYILRMFANSSQTE